MFSKFGIVASVDQFTEGTGAAAVAANGAVAVSPKGSVRQKVAALGRIEPESEIIDVGAPSAERFERLMVTEGEQVEVNQILGYLESHEERVAEREQIAAELREARQRLDAESSYYGTKVRDVNAGVNSGHGAGVKRGHLLMPDTVLPVVPAIHRRDPRCFV